MLARRFTIVCLIVALFGMGLAVLVAESSRPAHSYSQNTAGNCTASAGFSCTSIRHWQERPVR
jgi:hypothetical protein